QHRDSFTAVQNARRTREIRSFRHLAECRVTDAGVHGAMLARRLFHRLEVLYVVRKDDAGNGALVARDTHRAIDQLTNLLRRGYHVHILVRHVLEQGDQVDFLLIVTAECGALLLSDDGYDWLVVELRVVEAIEQMDGAGAGGGQANADLAGELGVRTRLECCELLMPRLHELDLVCRASECTDDAVDAVTWVSVHPSHAPLVEALKQKISDSSHLRTAQLTTGSRACRQQVGCRCRPHARLLAASPLTPARCDCSRFDSSLFY